MKLALQHLTKSFPTGGCGKSTTLNLISGLEKPTEGRILFDEFSYNSFTEEANMNGQNSQNSQFYSIVETAVIVFVLGYGLHYIGYFM